MTACYKCGKHWTIENRIETPLYCPECRLLAATRTKTKGKELTTSEQQEWTYRVEERLGILCGADDPTPAQLNMARAEADEWLRISRTHKPILEHQRKENQ